MAFQKEREDNKESSGLWFLECIAFGLGAPGLGFALYKSFSDDDKKDGEAPKPKDCEQCQASNDAYTRDRCFFCDDKILLKMAPYKVSCDHVAARFFRSVLDCATKLRCDHVKARYHDILTSVQWFRLREMAELLERMLPEEP